DAAGREKDESGLMPLAQLQDIDGSQQVMLKELATAGSSIDAGEHARVRRGIDDPINRRQRFEVTCVADISGENADAQILERPTVQLAAGTAEVIDSDNLADE